MGRISVSIDRRSILQPGRHAKVPVREPHFLGFEILCRSLEASVVRNKTLEALIMMSVQPIYTISAETGTNAAQTSFVYIGFLSYGVNGRKIILHTLTCIVATNGFQPLH